ncbi:MAG TPA: hypothetical protein PLL53_22205, partial [Saprospiraceae bacterium]|nr:hypothetical protein [Saprospiraceae bacterium]
EYFFQAALARQGQRKGSDDKRCYGSVHACDDCMERIFKSPFSKTEPKLTQTTPTTILSGKLTAA